MGRQLARRGRPPLMPPATREAMILDTAEQVLLQDGLRGLTMEAVARAAGMSKRTLYTHFRGRAALMAALIQRLRAEVIQPLTPAQTELPLARRLQVLLLPDAGRLARAAPLEVLRIVVAEAPQQPDLAERVLDEGPRSIRRHIRAELDRGVARGEIEIADTAMAAGFLFDMALACPFEAFLTPGALRPDPAERRQRVARAVALFLGGASTI